MVAFIGQLGRNVIHAIAKLGDASIFAVSTLRLLFATPWQGKHFVMQLYAVGVGSLIIIIITGAFTGMVLALQGYHMLVKVGTEALLGSAVALSLIRELGPVLAALMFVGRAGSSITAEIGIMRVTEQMDALEMMAVNPQARVMLTRIVACAIALPLLVGIFDVVGLAAGYLVGVEMLGVNSGVYIGETIDKIALTDVYAGLTKSMYFGLLVGIICTYMGQRATPTTEGVAKATTQAVMICSVMVLVLDYIITSFYL
ncbi:MAG TPA: ABC transporter permease [Ghiorsea sp.]|nr:ABC transporter permease [Ghiorsea sp.]HIP07490.1 ABC transporter permease [Mariprofundaceae bacterium]